MFIFISFGKYGNLKYSRFVVNKTKTRKKIVYKIKENLFIFLKIQEAKLFILPLVTLKENRI